MTGSTEAFAKSADDAKTAGAATGPAPAPKKSLADEWMVFPEAADGSSDALNASFVPLGCTGVADAHDDDTNVLPSATLSEILRALPAEAKAPSARLAVAELLATLAMVGVSVFAVLRLPWALLPLGWVLAGFALSHLYLIGHDCAHGTFVSSHRVNRLIGELCFLPLLRPFHTFAREHVAACRQHLPFFGANTTAPAAAAATAKPDAAAATSVYSSHEHVGPSTTGVAGGADTFGVIAGVRTTDLLFGATVAVIPLALYYGGLEAGGWALAKYWFGPLGAYRVTLPAVMSLWRAGCDVLLPPAVVSAIPSYRMRTVARAVRRTMRQLTPVPEETLNADHSSSSASDLSGSDTEHETGDGHSHGHSHGHGAADKTHAHAKSKTQQEREVEEDAAPPVGLTRAWLAYMARRIHWVNCVILIGTPALAVYGLATTPLVRNTAIWAFVYYMVTGLGITAGYHRLWAHRSYRASLPVRLFLMIGGSGALEGSIKWWCGGHRVHHRYTDTRYDPYNAKRGLLYSHIGWMMVHPRASAYRKADISDLNADPLVRLQHTFYGVVGPLCAFLLPALVAHYGWNDFWGGLYFAGALRLTAVHHNTFCVNSIAHHLGEQGYDDQRTPRDSMITALLTFGEGFHNYHHEFPNDYRNGIRAWDYDPTKWLIRGLYAFGLTSELKQFPANEIRMGQLVMQQKNIERAKRALRWPAPVAALPVVPWAAIKQQTKPDANGGAGRALVVVNNLVHDVTNFVAVHPGGAALLRSAVGTDATARFVGRTGVYAHSRAAVHLLSNFRVGRLPDDECVQHPPPLKPSEVAAVITAATARAMASGQNGSKGDAATARADADAEAETDDADAEFVTPAAAANGATKRAAKAAATVEAH